MTSTTTNYGLILYDDDTDVSASFIDFRMDLAGDTGSGGSGSSNMQIIDDELYKIDVNSSPQNKVLFNKVISPSTPSSGQSSLYIATSGSPFIKNDAGVESPIALGGVWQDWTPTLTGWSSNPTGTYKYSRVGNLMNLSIAQNNNGTSNATSLKISIPFTSTARAVGVAHAIDNGNYITTPAMALVLIGTSEIVFYTGWSGAGWTASAVKAIVYCSITVPI